VVVTTTATVTLVSAGARTQSGEQSALEDLQECSMTSLQDAPCPRAAYSAAARKASMSAAISLGYSPLMAWDASG
jgi:hypothetical protein